MDWRFIAQRLKTGEILDWDVPFTLTGNPRKDLSGPGSLVGTINPELGRLRADDGALVIDEWSTALYAEANNRIRWGGLVVGSGFQGEAWTVTCAGFTAYPHGIPYTGDVIRAGYKTTDDAGNDSITPPIDAFEVVRRIWAHVQSYPNGNLGLVVDTNSADYTLGAPNGSDPYELLWWNTPDCGDEIDSIAQEVPFDYVESHQWAHPEDPTDNTITHRLRLDRRIGRRRHDLRFAQGENIINIAEPTRLGEDFANHVLALGKGEGKKQLRVMVGDPDGHLRRVAVITRKHITNEARLTRIARRELRRRQEAFHVPLIEVKQHPNAVLGSWDIGDDILLDLDLPWLGHRQIWHRIVSEELSIATDTALLTLTPPGL